MAYNHMKTVKGNVVSSVPIRDDWEDSECLCQDNVPIGKRIDVQAREYDEKRGKWRWRNKIRYHQDCPIHGLERGNNKCQED